MQQPHHDDRHNRRKVFIGLSLAILLCSASQLCWKHATGDIPEGTGALQTLQITFSRGYFWAAAALYIWQFFNWMMVLRYADLSFAQPIAAGSYVVVGVAAWLLFKESLPPHRIAGIGLILYGVFWISRSPYRSGGPHASEILVEAQEQRV
jgi:drug/metabolite transporter (DMT)-like permease